MSEESLLRLYPTPQVAVSPREAYAAFDWEPVGDRPFLALNMVGSLDGRATLNGSAAGIGSPIDQLLMRLLRTNADALLWGAGTLRADRIGPIPPELVPLRVARGLAEQPLLVGLTASGDLPLERSVTAPRDRIVVFVAERTPAEAVARLQERALVHVVGEERPDPGAALRLLRRTYGVRHVLCEGGPVLNHSLLSADLLDELYLTVAPLLLAGEGLPLVRGPLFAPPLRLVLRTLHAHADELYLRYAVAR